MRKRPTVDPLDERCVPVLFATRDSAPGRNQIKRNQLLPQDKGSVRAWGESFGENADGVVDFNRLSYVRIVVAPDRDVADRIVGSGMNLDEAIRYIESLGGGE